MKFYLIRKNEIKDIRNRALVMIFLKVQKEIF